MGSTIRLSIAAVPMNESNIHDRNKPIAEHWFGGNAREAGRLAFERIPVCRRPLWAARIFVHVLERARIELPVFAELIEMATRDELWPLGHQMFSKLRDMTLELDDVRERVGLSEAQSLLSSILSLAELVAKVIYNAPDPYDPFDEDSGWWIAVSLRAFVDNRWKDAQFADVAWSLICFDEHVG